MFKKKKTERWGLVDASREDLPLSLGVVVSKHGRLMDAICAQILFEQGQENPRTRIIRLAKPVPEGSPIDPGSDVAPMTGSE
jgi:hypothetical protein